MAGTKITTTPFERYMPRAVNHFWAEREAASERQKAKGAIDQGNRSGVTAGKNLDGFVEMLRKLILANGLKDAEVFTQGRADLTIPGYYRPTKNWDLLVVRGDELVAAVEFKSQVGPSFGNNFNNRVEEALGNATDLNTAFREGGFGDSSKPFTAYLFVLEDCPKSRRPVRISSPHFPTFPEFHESSYADRYEVLCRRLVQERLYDAAALVLTSRDSPSDWTDASELTSAKRLAIGLATKVAAVSLE